MNVRNILTRLAPIAPAIFGAIYSADIVFRNASWGWETLNALLTLFALLYFAGLTALFFVEPELALRFARAGSVIAAVLFTIQIAIGPVCASCMMQEALVIASGLWLGLLVGVHDDFSVRGCLLLALVAFMIVQPTMTPIARYSAAAGDRELKAVDEGGREADLSGRAVLVFAPWCEYCHGVLKLVAEMPEQERPALVSLGNPDAETVAATKKLLIRYNLSSYYGYVKTDQVPVLILPDSRRIAGDRNISDYLSEEVDEAV